MFYSNPKTLIVVYKDEMLLNQLKKMVETNDDIDEENPVGTLDDSINIVAWSEKVWLGNKKAGNIKDKVLFLGDIKGTDKLIPVIDVKFERHGVKFGWAGNQAILFADPSAIGNKEKYLEFARELMELPVPDVIKHPKGINLKDLEIVQTVAVTENTEETPETESADIEDKKKGPAFLLKAREGLLKGVDNLSKTGVKVAVATEDLLRDKGAVRKQMMFYGVINLYRNCLNDFMKV